MTRSLVFIFLFFFVSSISSSAAPVATDAINGITPLQPSLYWLADPDKKHNEIFIPTNQGNLPFLPFKEAVTLKSTGSGWLRFNFSKSELSVDGAPAAKRNAPITLQIGNLPTGTSTLIYSRTSNQNNISSSIHRETIFPYSNIELPEPSLNGLTVYIHMEETPGLWFSPTVSRSDLHQPILPPDLLLPGILLSCIALCFLRAIAERSILLLWSAFSLGLVLVQVLLPLPLTDERMRFEALPALLAPGLCILIFPHLGRLILRLKKESPFQDNILKLLSFLGAVLCIVPLLPDFGWTMRLFNLWPILLTVLLPSSLGALGKNKSGSLAFFGICFLGAVDAGIAIYFMGKPEMHPMIQYAGIWGVAVGGIGLALIPIVKEEKEIEDTAEEPSLLIDEKSLNNTITVFSDTSDILPNLPETKEGPLLDISSEGFSQELPNSDSEDLSNSEADLKNFSLLKIQSNPINSLDIAPPNNKEDSSRTYSSSGEPLTFSNQNLLENKEIILPVFLEERIQSEKEDDIDTEDNLNTFTSKNSSISKDLEQHNKEDQNLNSIFQKDEVSEKSDQSPKIISLTDDEFFYEDEDEPPFHSSFKTSAPFGDSFIFSLHGLVREVHNVVAPLAREKGILFSWFIAPSLPFLFEGDAPRLRQTLALLLQNAVQATSKGAVQLFIRHNPSAKIFETGNLQFTVSDTAAAQREDVGYFHAWELAQNSGGTFSLEYSADGGTLSVFTINFGIPSEESTQEFMENTRQNNVILDDLIASGKIPLSEIYSYSNDTLFPLTKKMLSDLIDKGNKPPQWVEDKKLEVEAKTVAPPFATEPDVSSNKKQKADSTPLIILTNMTTSSRRLLAHYLAGFTYLCLDAQDMEKTRELFDNEGASLIIYDADSPEDSIFECIQYIAQKATTYSETPTQQLILCGHKAQVKRMEEAGATAVLLKPFSQQSFIDIVCEAIPEMKKEKIAQQGFMQASYEVFEEPTFSQDPIINNEEEQTNELESSTLPDNRADNDLSQRGTLNNTPTVQAAPLLLGLSQEDVSLDTKEHELFTAELHSLEMPKKNTTDEPIASHNSEETIEPLPIKKDPPPKKLLPGMTEEYIETYMLPLVPGLMYSLMEAIEDAVSGQEKHQPLFVQEAVGRLAKKAEAHGLNRLSKIAFCVERAAEAEDSEAIDTLLLDLIEITKRYVSSLQKCYDDFCSHNQE